MTNSLREILEWLMDTALAISGSTDDVEVIEKDQDKLLDQAEEKIEALFQQECLPYLEIKKIVSQYIDDYKAITEICYALSGKIPKQEAKEPAKQTFTDEDFIPEVCEHKWLLKGKSVYECEKCGAKKEVKPIASCKEIEYCDRTCSFNGSDDSSPQIIYAPIAKICRKCQKPIKPS